MISGWTNYFNTYQSIYFAKSINQDQTANTCSLILLCTLRCMISWWKDYLKTYLLISFADSVDQDQTAHTCSLILLCTLHCSTINICQEKPYPILLKVSNPKDQFFF